MREKQKSWYEVKEIYSLSLAKFYNINLNISNKKLDIWLIEVSIILYIWWAKNSLQINTTRSQKISFDHHSSISWFH